MLAPLAERPVAARLLAGLLFLLVAGSLAFPLLAVAVDERSAEASGLELVAGDAELAGRYVHGAYAGEAERLVDEVSGPARGVLLAAAGGLALVWLPGRAGLLAGAVLALLALVWLLVLHQTATSAFDLVDATVRFGFVPTAVAALGALAWCSFAASRQLWWWRPKPPPARDYYPRALEDVRVEQGEGQQPEDDERGDHQEHVREPVPPALRPVRHDGDGHTGILRDRPEGV